MKIKNILHWIFEVTNKKDQKVITILGVKFHYKRPEKMYIFEHIYCYLVRKFCKVKNNKIIIFNALSWNYSCNPKYIALELAKRNFIDYDIVWVHNDITKTIDVPKSFRLVKYTSLQFLYELLTAKVWIINSHMFLPYKKGLQKASSTIYCQTFHGSMGIKKTDGDTKNCYENLGWYKWQHRSASDFDYIFVDSEFEKQAYVTGFWGYGQILKLGKARDSIFYKDPTPYIEKVKEFYNIPKENKILLYAPTWRSDKRCNCYNIDIKALKKALKKRFGGEWSVLIRAHIHMKKNIFNALYDENEVINASNYIDMQELLVAADVLISDYSSCLPEYTILMKPSFTYATDIENYEQGLYYPLTDLPSPLATDNYELINNVLNFDEKLFKQKAEQFLIDKGHQDDENSCVRIVDFILEKMNEKSK